MERDYKTVVTKSCDDLSAKVDVIYDMLVRAVKADLIDAVSAQACDRICMSAPAVITKTRNFAVYTRDVRLQLTDLKKGLHGTYEFLESKLAV